MNDNERKMIKMLAAIGYFRDELNMRNIADSMGISEEEADSLFDLAQTHQ